MKKARVHVNRKKIIFNYSVFSTNRLEFIDIYTETISIEDQ